MVVNNGESGVSYRFWALLLSAAAHVGFAFSILDGSNPADNIIMHSPPVRGDLMITDVLSSESLLQRRSPEGAILDFVPSVVGAAGIKMYADDVAAQASVTADDKVGDTKSIDATYLPTTALTKSPRIKVDIPADFSLPVTNGSSRIAVLRLFITENGDVVQVLVEEASVSEEDQIFLKDVFSKTKFYAGEINGTFVKSQLIIEIDLNEATNESSNL